MNIPPSRVGYHHWQAPVWLLTGPVAKADVVTDWHITAGDKSLPYIITARLSPFMALRVISLPRSHLVFFSERSGHRATLTEHDLGMLEFWDGRRRRHSKPL